MECGYCLSPTENLRKHLRNCKQMKYLIKEFFKIEDMTLERAIELMACTFYNPDEEEIRKSNEIIRNSPQV